MLEYMLRMCILNFKGGWEQYLLLVEFVYNNLYQFRIGMAPYEALYGRTCQSPAYWLEVGDNKLLRLEMIQDTSFEIAYELHKIARRDMETQIRCTWNWKWGINF